MSETAQVPATDLAAAKDEALVADLLAERDRRIWKAEDLERERCFGQPYMRLCGYLRKPGAVTTPQGLGTLIDVKSYGCRVLLLRGAQRRTKEGKRVPKTKNFSVEDVRPYRGERG